MSGSNPFRPKKPETLPVTAKPIDSPVSPPAVAPTPDDKPNAFFDLPHQNPSTQDVDDSLSSDDDSTSDPFHQNTYLSDNDGEEGSDHNQNRLDRRWSSFPRSHISDDPLQARAPYSAASSTSLSSSTVGTTSVRKENRAYPENLASNTTFPTPPAGTGTASSSSTDVSQQSVRPGTLNDFTIGKRMSNVDIDMNSRALTSRSTNREKKPPPPPKNRHGKLIRPPPQTAPAASTSRFSFHGTSPEISFSHSPSTPSHSRKQSLLPGTDYFSPKSTENENSTPDALGRSNSQHKRPPTPPISRRHSQMTRSKPTLSKTNSNRSSIPIGKERLNASPPPSPGAISLSPSLRKQSRSSSLQTDENALKYTPPREEQDPVKAAMPSPSVETSRLPSPKRASYTRRTTQGAASSAVPPPPPPRRARFSNDGTRPTSVLLEKPAEEDSFPNPSNANHILDDLSRLQKEVDDLRGRYEGRKPSH